MSSIAAPHDGVAKLIGNRESLRCVATDPADLRRARANPSAATRRTHRGGGAGMRARGPGVGRPCQAPRSPLHPADLLLEGLHRLLNGFGGRGYLPPAAYGMSASAARRKCVQRRQSDALSASQGSNDCVVSRSRSSWAVADRGGGRESAPNDGAGTPRCALDICKFRCWQSGHLGALRRQAVRSREMLQSVDLATARALDPFKGHCRRLRAHFSGEEALVGGAQPAAQLPPHVHLDERDRAAAIATLGRSRAARARLAPTTTLGHVVALEHTWATRTLPQ